MGDAVETSEFEVLCRVKWHDRSEARLSKKLMSIGTDEDDARTVQSSRRLTMLQDRLIRLIVSVDWGLSVVKE